MKTIKCSDIGGGDCSFAATTNTVEEVKAQLKEHSSVAHADMLANMTPEMIDGINNKVDELWAVAPENTETTNTESASEATAPEADAPAAETSEAPQA